MLLQVGIPLRVSEAGREVWPGAPGLSPPSTSTVLRRGFAGSGFTTSITSGIYVCKQASDASRTHDPGHDNYRVHGSTEASLMMGVIAIILRQPQVPTARLTRWCLPRRGGVLRWLVIITFTAQGGGEGGMRRKGKWEKEGGEGECCGGRSVLNSSLVALPTVCHSVCYRSLRVLHGGEEFTLEVMSTKKTFHTITSNLHSALTQKIRGELPTPHSHPTRLHGGGFVLACY